MKSDTQKWVTTALVWLLYATALTPLFYYKGLFYPYTTSKAFFFRVLVEVSLALFTFLFVTGKIQLRIGILKNRFTWLPAVFLVASIVSSFFGIDPFYSFFSSFTRMEGVLTLFHLTVYFYLLLLVFGKKEWNIFLYAVSGASILVALSGIFESFGIMTFGVGDTSRVGGTINNAAFLASYLTFTAPLTLYLALKERKKNNLFYGLLIGTVVSFFGILVTGTRGAVIGFVGASGILLFLGIFFTEKEKIKKFFYGGLIILVVILVGGFLLRETLKGSDIDIVRRIASISFEDATTKSRLFIWEHSLPYVFEKPIFGYGPESFEYIYNKEYDPSVISEEWFDRSHNAYLDALLQGGVVGFFLYLSLYFVMGYLIWETRKKEEKMFYLFSFLFVAYAVQNFFVFDSLNTSFVFYAFLSYLMARPHENREDEQVNSYFLKDLKGNTVVFQVISFLVIILSFISMYWFVYLPFRANRLLVEGYLYQIVDSDKSLYLWEKGLALKSGYETDYGYQSYDSYFNRRVEGIAEEDLLESYEYSVKLLKNLILEYPWNARLYVYLSHVMEDRPVRADFSEEEYQMILDKALELTPLRKQPHYMSANVHLSRVQNAPYLPSERVEFEKGVGMLKNYAELVPLYAEPRFILANLLRQNGRKEEAKEYFKEGLLLYRPDAHVAERVISYYLSESNFKDVEPYYEFIINEDPNNTDFLFDLAHVYSFNGKNDLAKEVLLKIRNINPAIFEDDPQFVRNILGE